MSSIIQDLWIFSRDGIPIVEIFHNSKVDSILLGAFLSAIESFSKEVTGVDIRSFSFGNSKFILTSSLKRNIFLVSRTGIKVKTKKVMKIFKIITDFFEELYTINDIENWDGDLSLFDRFKDRIELYFQMSEL
jgi:hypothetical protein